MQAERLLAMEGTLGKKARQLLAALETLGPGWWSRLEIAGGIGKDRLNPGEITLLDMLAAQGVLESAMQPKPTLPQVNQWVYRLPTEQKGA